jgi:hypothetical protein
VFADGRTVQRGGTDMNYLGIDVPTKSKGAVMRKLARLKPTESVEDGGVYHQDTSIGVVRVTTIWTEEQLDHWLWATKGVDYIGTFKLL